MIPLTDPCVTEKSEVGQDCNKETESSIEVTDLKQDEESLNPCKERCANEKENDWQELTKDVQNTEKCSENTECCDQEANSEAVMDFLTEDLVSAIECVNKFDHRSPGEGEMAKEEEDTSKEDKIAKEEEDIFKEDKIAREKEEISEEDKILEEDEIFKEDKMSEEDEEISNIFNTLSLDSESDNIDISCELDSDSKTYEVMNENSETAFCTLADRELMSTEEGSVLHCLYQFTRNEKLCENNKLLCDVCTRRQLCGPKNSATSMPSHFFTC